MNQAHNKRGLGSNKMSAAKKREIQSAGGKSSPTNFKNDSARASALGKEGGSR